jgi:hypothetical protein
MPLSAIFSPFVGAVGPDYVASRSERVSDQQVFVKQLDAQASTVRNLNEGETT